MAVIIIILLCVTVLAFVLWGVICAAILRFSHRLKNLNCKERLKTVLACAKEFSRKRLFYAFLTAEVGLAGGFIPIVAKVWFVNSNCAFFLEISDQPAWLSLAIAILIAFGFYLIMNSSDKKQPEKWNQVIDAALFINNELNFTPSKKWFEEQNDLAIKALGKRYSPEVNFPFDDMEWAMAALRIDDGFSELLWNELDDELQDIKSYLRNRKQHEDDKTKALCDEVTKRINNLDENALTYIELRKSVFSLQDDLYDYEIHKDEYSEYSYRSVREKTAQLDNVLKNIWIDLKASKYWIIAGEAGMGKSHLIGDMVTRRKTNGEPTILLLGEQFAKDVDPIIQIKNKLEIQYRSENMLQRFDSYGQRIGKPVVFFIDALNEGGGDGLWMKYWDEFIARFSKFEHLRLVVSFRISRSRNWFYDLAKQNDKTHVYFHRGFNGNEKRASEFMFSSYGLDQPLWPSYGSEFANPLFLKTYCRLHEKTGKPLNLDNLWIVFNEYCESVNHELAIKKGYSDSLSLVTDAMNCIADLMIQKGSRWRLEYKTVNEALVNVAELFQDPKEFMNIMVDEGLLRIDTYEDKDHIDFGYELIGDYFIANNLLEQNDTIDEDQWRSFGNGVSEAMAIIAPYKKKVEVFEIVEKVIKEDALDAMIESSGWRDSFTSKGQHVIDLLTENKEYRTLFNIILKRPFRSDDTANSTKLYELLWSLNMSERDAIWTTSISTEWDLGRNIMDLAEWGMHASPNALLRVDSDTIYRCAETIVWSFSSTWRQLRDTATHALVNIFVEKKELIVPLLQKYYTINDPYIEERLWASVFGALTLCQDKTIILEVAKWVYSKIFIIKKVPENILVRDYAKGIVRYAKQIGVDIDFDEIYLTLPYTDEAIPKVLTCKQITEKYDNDDWKNMKETELNVWRAKQAILDSMATEHSARTSMYGDFGRYVFQSSMSDFPVNPEDMSNWAIEMIFEEYGYDPKVFSNFDVLHRSYDRSHNDIERIGKKYQWIAMYRILARLSDVYPDIVFEDSFYTPTQSARNIDPTYKVDTKLNDNRNSKYSVPQFDVTHTKGELKWLKQWREMPPIEDYLLTTDKDGVEWVNLFSYNAIKSPKNFSNHDGWIREIWTFVQAFVVKKVHLKTVCREIHRVGLEGRDFRENREIDGIYAREFYWADIYRDRCKEEYYGFAPLVIDHKEFHDINIAPTYLQYNHSSSEDTSIPDGSIIIMPNEWLYKELGLHYGKTNGVWVNKNDVVIAVDNAEYCKGHSALLIRKEVFLEYLNNAGLVLFWPILTERQARLRHGIGDLGYEQNGGWAYMDENGIIHHKFRSYVPTDFQKKKRKIKMRLEKRAKKWRNQTCLFLHKHKIRKMPIEQLLDIMCGDDYKYPFETDVFDNTEEDNSDNEQK